MELLTDGGLKDLPAYIRRSW